MRPLQSSVQARVICAVNALPAASIGLQSAAAAAQTASQWRLPSIPWRINTGISNGSNQDVAQTTAAPAAAGGGGAGFDVQRFLSTCGRRVTDGLTQVATACHYSNSSSLDCQQLAAQNLITSSSQSFTPPSLNGNFSSPVACGTSRVALSLKGDDLLLHSPTVPVLAVVAREAGGGAKAFLLGSGVSQVRTYMRTHVRLKVLDDC
jgi:hypothetical protein